MCFRMAGAGQNSNSLATVISIAFGKKSGAAIGYSLGPVRSRLRQPVTYGIPRKPKHVADLELVHDVGLVGDHGLTRDVQPVCDFLCPVALTDQPQYLQFPAGELPAGRWT